MNIEAEHLRYAAGGKFRPSREIFRDVSLRIAHGECAGVIGREGSGKTTLLNLLGGLVAPSGGRVLLDGVDVWNDARAAGDVRLRTAFTFQFPEEQFLSPEVGEEFTSLLRLRGVPEREAEERRRLSLVEAGLVGSIDDRRSPFSLSLGESRRLALALVASLRPAAAFLDEPTSGLDASGAACAGRILASLIACGCTVVIATHDIEFLAGLATSVIVVEEGGIAARGDAGLVLADAPLLAAHGYALPAVRRTRR